MHLLIKKMGKREPEIRPLLSLNGSASAVIVTASEDGTDGIAAAAGEEYQKKNQPFTASALIVASVTVSDTNSATVAVAVAAE